MELSIKDKIEAVRVAEKEGRAAAKKQREKASEEARNFFAPVYKAFLEIEKEFGSGKGLRIVVNDYMCVVHKEGSADKLELSCFGFCKDKIIIREVNDFSSIPDSELDPIMETRKEVDSAEEAIEIAIEYIGKNIT